MSKKKRLSQKTYIQLYLEGKRELDTFKLSAKNLQWLEDHLRALRDKEKEKAKKAYNKTIRQIEKEIKRDHPYLTSIPIYRYPYKVRGTVNAGKLPIANRRLTNSLRENLEHQEVLRNKIKHAYKSYLDGFCTKQLLLVRLLYLRQELYLYQCMAQDIRDFRVLQSNSR